MDSLSRFCPFLINSFNEAFTQGELSLTQKQGIIICLPKGNKPREILKHRRPISLLNIDYKILSGVLARRLKKILPKIISETQKGFLQGRYIGENVRLVFDMMSELSHLKKKGLILLLDFEKAFDSLEWSYITEVLKHYNFGEGFIRWFKTLYNKSSSCVINNGFFSDFFELGRGCRQGDPLSPYIFILAIEPLANEIKENKLIKGIEIANTTYKIGQYADDTFLLLDGSEESVRQSMVTFKFFYLCSGLKLNFDKTVAVWIGQMVDADIVLCPEIKMTWSNSFTLLGIDFNTDLKQMIKNNYESKVQIIKNTLNSYKKRHMSMLGKVTVLKTIIIPKLVYLMKVLPSPNMAFFAEMERCFKNFIWEEKKPKIIISQLEKDIAEGGLRLTNLSVLNKALKITWIPKIVKEEGLWQDLFESSIVSNRKNIWMQDLLSLHKMKRKVKNLFWKEVISAWVSYKEISIDEIDVRTFPIWNSHFLQNSNIIMKKNEFKKRGLVYINDLLTDMGELMGYDNFQETYFLNINFVDFYSLMHSIPRPWKTEILQQKYKIIGQVTQTCLEETLTMKKVCKETYWKIMDTIKPKRNFLNKWSEYFQTQITEKEMSEYFTLNFLCTNENKMRSFQYKILQRSLTTNKFLNICKLGEDKCYFCKIEVETLEHLFWDCSKIKKFWASIVELLEPFIKLHDVIDNKAVLLGTKDGQYNILVNHIINIIKHYIYTTKCNNRILSQFGALAKVREVFCIEQNILLQYKKENNLLNNKWDPLLNFFQEVF